MLNLKTGEKVLIPGVGTGLDLPLIPPGVLVTGIDLSEPMLAKAQAKVNSDITLLLMDAQVMRFPDASFDAVILNLILSVVPDGSAAFREAWRVLRPGGRAIIFDKFIPETGQINQLRRIIGSFFRAIGTDPNRKLSDILAGTSSLNVAHDEPSLLNGQYRILLIQKLK